VDQQSSYVLRMPRRLVRYSTTFRVLSGWGGRAGGCGCGGASLASLASILCWNALTRARTMPGNLCISRFLTPTWSPPPPPPGPSGFLIHSSLPGGSSGGGGISSSAFRNAAMTSGSNSGDPGADFSRRSSPSASPSSSLSSRPSMSSHTLITSGSRTCVLAGDPGTCFCHRISCGLSGSGGVFAAPTTPPSSRHFIISSSSRSRLSDPSVEDLSATPGSRRIRPRLRHVKLRR